MFRSYYTPPADDYDPAMGWTAWDDLCTNHGPSYAMLNCGAMGYTIEIPCNNEASTRLFGVRHVRHDRLCDGATRTTSTATSWSSSAAAWRTRTTVPTWKVWYVDISNKTSWSPTPGACPMPRTTTTSPSTMSSPWMPTASATRRRLRDGRVPDPQRRQGRRLTADAKVGGTTYKAGSLVVDMYQAKRNYANAVLWQGADASASGFPDLYPSPSPTSPRCAALTASQSPPWARSAASFEELTDVTGKTELSGPSRAAVVMSNNGNEAVRAVNALLDDGQDRRA